MIRAVRQMATVAVILIAFCIVCRMTLFTNYTAYIQMPVYDGQLAADGYRLIAEDPDILNVDRIESGNGFMRVTIEPEKRGHSDITMVDQQGETRVMVPLYVGRFRTVYNLATGGFTGDGVVMAAVTLFWLTVFMIMLWNYRQAKGSAFYAYSTIYFAGFSLFALVTGLLMLEITVKHVSNPAHYSMLNAYSVINSASIQFMMFTMPLIVVFAVAMIVSNIVLLRHERPRIQNALGILIGVVLLTGEAVGYFVYKQDFSGSEMQVRVRDTLIHVCATVFVYFECMLAGSVICGVKSAAYRPAPDKDFIIILGCWFRKDGSLPPLLRGRVDKALEFWKGQIKACGKEAVIIPSGGQGANESMAEAEAMRRYLLSNGVPERVIRMEDQSRNTYQNMEFSKRIIDAEQPRAKTVFATTNYHVFRSGVWSNLAGLHAEGIGGKTKWWFWPNAFMRECVGLLQKRWKQELVFLLLLLVFFGTLTMILG